MGRTVLDWSAQHQVKSLTQGHLARLMSDYEVTLVNDNSTFGTRRERPAH